MISNVGKYIPLIFIITFVFIIFDTVISFQEVRNIRNYQNMVAHTYQIINDATYAQLALAQANTEQKKYILSTKITYLQEYQRYRTDLNHTLTSIKNNTENSQREKKTITEFSKVLVDKEALLSTEITLAQQGNTSLPDYMLQQEDTINIKVNNISTEIIGNESSYLKRGKMLLDISTTYMYTTIILSGLLTLVLLIFAYLAIMRELRQRTMLENKKNEFISLASHELKTPITTMSIFAELLSQSIRKGSNKKSEEIIHKMSMQINEMKNLINDLLDVTRIHLGKLKIEKGVIMLDELIQETIAEIQPTTKKHKIIYKDDKSIEILGDRQRIWQVLTNLLNNAIKYSPKGGSIIVMLANKSHFAQISVQDKGMGINRKNISHIFDRYFREEGNTEKQFSGLGLGLYLSQEIITLHGGKIWVRSTRGKGSTFFFTIPLTRRKIKNKKG